MTVYLVGAGPGDPGLMTKRSLDLIATADVVIYDRLIPANALDGARPDATLIYAGKEGHGPSMPQREINELILEHGRGGAEVVRLKGGDPFVFGRGGEEAELLASEGIPFEVVPGVTAGVAAPAYAGIPVTYRGAASSVAFLTGHENPDKPESSLDWRALAAFPGTLVVFMGVKQLPQITARLIEGGREPQEPAALVQSGTLPGQRAVVATLATVAQVAVDEQIKAPTIAVFGPVAALREELAWIERRPLYGRRIAVTRAQPQASQLAARLRALGAEVVEAPVIRLEPIPGPAPDLSGYDLICLTSPNGVDALFERLRAAGQDARACAGAKVAAIGPGTARRLEAHGITPDLVPERFVAEGLVEALADVPIQRALVARASAARNVLPNALRRRGIDVEILDLYQTVVATPSPDEVASVFASDYVTFASSSAVTNFLTAVGADRARGWVSAADGAKVVSIGPVTSGTLREHGIEPAIEARQHDIDGLIAAMIHA